MRTSEGFALHTAPVFDLRRLAEGEGPYLSVYLTVDTTADNAGSRNLLRWRALAEADLRDAPPAALDAVAAVVADAHTQRSGAALGVIADAAGVRIVDRGDEALGADRAAFGAAPDVTPLVKWRQDRVPHVVVRADRGGAEIVGATAAGDASQASVDETPERKSAPGGWSQRRFQQRAEDDWAKTAKQVVGRIVEVADEVGARLVVLGGDVRAVQLISDGLPGRLADLSVTIDYGRAEDGSDAARHDEVRRLVATAAANETVACLERFKQERGQADLAAAGLAETADAVARGGVEILLVHDRGGNQISTLVRDALRSGASIRVVPEHGPVPDGVGALLRWA